MTPKNRHPAVSDYTGISLDGNREITTISIKTAGARNRCFWWLITSRMRPPQWPFDRGDRSSRTVRKPLDRIRGVRRRRRTDQSVAAARTWSAAGGVAWPVDSGAVHDDAGRSSVGLAERGRGRRRDRGRGCVSTPYGLHAVPGLVWAAAIDTVGSWVSPPRCCRRRGRSRPTG
jgi:hypothetical protein